MEEWLLHFVGLNKFVVMAARESPPPPANMVGALKELVPPHPLPTWWGPLSTRWIKEFNSCRLSHKEEREAEKERQTPSSP